MKRDNIALFAVVMCGLAALVWTAIAVVHICYRHGPVTIALNSAAALIWWTSFAVNLWRYRGARPGPPEG